jgi:hypothetical protein
MARTGSTAETSTINRVTKSVSALDVSGYCRDLESWPRSWMGWEKDLPPGERLVACFRLFIQHVASSGLSGKTIRRHVDNLWLLGGEIIRDLNQTPSLRKVDVERLLKDRIHEDGGPLIPHGSEDEQRSFDSTCRKLHRFLAQAHT